MKTIPFRTSTPVSLFLTVALMATVPSCRTTDSAPDGHFAGATIAVSPPARHLDRRAYGDTIVSVNGKPVGRETAPLAPGRNQLKIAYRTPAPERQIVPLSFTARPDQSYFIRYYPFPPTPANISDNYDESVLGGALLEGAVNLDILGAFLLPPVYAAAVAEPVARAAHQKITDQRDLPQYVDISVISDDPSEGVVRRVRSYPDGTVDTPQ